MLKYIGERLQKAYYREEHLHFEEWAEKKVVFRSTDVSPLLGNLNLKYSPHYRKLMQLIERPLTMDLYAKWASQSGKSLFGMLCAAYKLDTQPATVLYMQPIKEDIPKMLSLKVNPILKSIPDLWAKFEDYKEQEKIRTKDAIKKLAGGNLVVSGSSVKERKSLTTPMLIADEVAEFDKGAFSEARERTKSYRKFFPKHIGLSTIVNPEDEIFTNYDSAEVKLEWRYICPECSKDFYPDMIKYPTREEYDKEDYVFYAKKNAYVECPHCKYHIDNETKDKMIFNGGMDWFVVDKNGSKLFKVEDLTNERSFGVDMNSLGSYFAPYEDIVDELIKAGDDPIKLDKVYRGWLNKFYEDEKTEKREADELTVLSLGLEEFIIPDDTIAVYLTVDTQKDHFWVLITAFRLGVNPHVVWAGRVETFNDIDALYDLDLYYQDGTKWGRGIKRQFIDMQGYVEKQNSFNEDTGEVISEIVVSRPLEVRDYVIRRAEELGSDSQYERIYPTKGQQFLANDEPYAFGTMSYELERGREKYKMKYVKLGTVYLKLQVMQSIYNGIQAINQELDVYEKCLTINDTIIEKYKNSTKHNPYNFLEQITSEIYGYDPNSKSKYKVFIQVKPQNHLLDCMVMAWAGAIMDNLYAVKEVPPKQTAKVDLKSFIV